MTLSQRSLADGTFSICIPMMFLSADFLSEKRIWLVTMDLLYIRLTYYIQDNQQGCFRLSSWFPLWCLGTDLPPVWLFTFRFVSKGCLVCKFDIMMRIFACDFFGLTSCLCTLPKFYLFFFPNEFALRKLLYYVLRTVIFHRRSLYSFLSMSKSILTYLICIRDLYP